MKLMTLNTHSLVEENYEKKLDIFVKGVISERPDIIALQEVNQSIDADLVKSKPEGYFKAEKTIKLKSDNHILNVYEKLKNAGFMYHFTITPPKRSYGKFEESVGIMSFSPILEVSIKTISKVNDYENWKTRKIVGIRTKEYPQSWFYSVHFGWWNDSDEPFLNQWKNTLDELSGKENVWLMGDTNSPDIKGESYEEIVKSGFYDSYILSDKKDDGFTVEGIIDGWRDKGISGDGMRIDQIFTDKKIPVKSSRVIFNGKYFDVVSDHFGVIVEV